MKPQHKFNADPQWQPLFETIRKQWYNQGANETLNWIIFDDSEDGCQIHVAPCFQEIIGGKNDGSIVWTPFIFDIGEFIKAVRGRFIINKIGISSHYEAASATPMIIIEAETIEENQTFRLNVHLEPPADSEALEVIDTIHNQIREKEA